MSMREVKIVHPEGYTEYKYFGTWSVVLHNGQVVECKDVDLAPYGNRIPEPVVVIA